MSVLGRNRTARSAGLLGGVLMLLALALVGCSSTRTTSPTTTVVRTVTASAEATTTAPSQTVTVPASPPVETDCGMFRGSRLKAKGIDCAGAKALYRTLESGVPKGWSCAASGIVCWKGWAYETATRGFSLLSEEDFSCPPGEVPAGDTGACAPAPKPPPPACRLGSLTISGSNISCDRAQYVLYAYLNDYTDEDGRVLESNPPPSYWNPDGLEITWSCSGGPGGGGCHDDEGVGSFGFG